MDKEATTTAKIIIASLIFVFLLAFVITLLKGGTPDEFISFLAGLSGAGVLISLIFIAPKSREMASVIGTLKNWGKLSAYERLFFVFSNISYLTAFILFIAKDFFDQFKTIIIFLMCLMYALSGISYLLFIKKDRHLKSFPVKEQIYFTTSLVIGIVALVILGFALSKRFGELVFFGFTLLIFSAFMGSQFEKRIKEIDGHLSVK